MLVDYGRDVMGMGHSVAHRNEVPVRRTRVGYGVGLLMSVLVLGALTLLPAPAMAAGSIGSLSINPDSVRGGGSTTGTVDLGFADTGPPWCASSPATRP